MPESTQTIDPSVPDSVRETVGHHEVQPSCEQIAQRAYRIWLKHGKELGGGVYFFEQSQFFFLFFSVNHVGFAQEEILLLFYKKLAVGAKFFLKCFVIFDGVF